MFPTEWRRPALVVMVLVLVLVVMAGGGHEEIRTKRRSLFPNGYGHLSEEA
jgi:hypothetical protein